MKCKQSFGGRGFVSDIENKYFFLQKDGSVSLTNYLETWQEMEEAKELNLTRSIGVSNFNITQMQRLWDGSRIKPAVLQIEVPMLDLR